MPGAGTSSQTQQQQQQSQTNPWAPTQGTLQNIIGSINGVNPAVTGNQYNSAANLVGAANGLPNFGNASAGVASGLLGGDPTGLLNSSLKSYQNNVNPIATESLNPLQNPQIQQLLQTIQNQTTNSVNSQFAGAGRSNSGENAEAIALGLSQGEAAPLLNQYNQNVSNVLGANSGLLNAAQGTAGAITGNQQAGLGAAAAQPGIAMSPALAQLQAAQTQYNLPISNLGGIEGLTLPIAGLGGQSTSSGSGTTTNNPSILSDIAQGVGILGGNNGLFGGQYNAAGGLLKFAGV